MCAPCARWNDNVSALWVRRLAAVDNGEIILSYEKSEIEDMSWGPMNDVGSRCMLCDCRICANKSTQFDS